MATTSKDKFEQEFPFAKEYVTKVLIDAVKNYLQFLCVISSKYLVDLNNKEINKKTFEEVRRELYEFVKGHKENVLFGWYVVEIPDQNAFAAKFDMRNLDTAETFIDFEKFVEFFQQEISVIRDTDVEYVKTLIHKTVDTSALFERAFEKQIAEITLEDVVNLEVVTHLDDHPAWKGGKISYGLLRQKLERRTSDFRNELISTERMEELSFTFDDAAGLGVQVGNTECSVCLENYESGQVVCRMPCGHFFHRRCLDEWFKPEKFWADSDSEDRAGEGAEESERKKFQCPNCRHNCC